MKLTERAAPSCALDIDYTFPPGRIGINIPQSRRHATRSQIIIRCSEFARHKTFHCLAERHLHYPLSRLQLDLNLEALESTLLVYPSQ
jgi:hypothetical protein